MAEVIPSPESITGSPSTAVTTPDHSPGEDDNVWASDGEHDSSSTMPGHRQEMLSDLPSVRRQHMTDGYREGLSIGKAKVMQQGFDQGFPIGVKIALRAGKILGLIEGCLACKSVSDDRDKHAALQKLYEEAKTELSCSALLKNVNEQIVADATDIPESTSEVLTRWERLLFGQPDQTSDTAQIAA